MPTNEQRRATAKRKLDRQLERRAEKERKRRMYTIIGVAAAALVVIVAVVATVVITNRDSGSNTASGATTAATSATPTPATPPAPGQLPAFTAPAGLGQNCQYPASPEPASKKVKPPRTGKVPTEPAQISASMATTQGNIGLMLDNGKSPCTVNSFASLAQQGFFNDTGCHRLTTSPSLSVLQCGDPTGEGTGGPGYQFANEYPTNQYQPDDPKLLEPVIYPRGTLAMAHSQGQQNNGSQFFLVFKDSQLPPDYTVFGTIDETGLATLDKIGAAGVAGGGEDGKPALDVKVKSILLD